MSSTAPTVTETILLAEDDPLLRGVLRRALKGHRYHLLEASDGDEALDLAAQHPGTIHVLLADLVMPVMDGFTLAERLGETHPETRVVFMTGYVDQSESVRVRLEESGRPFLLKPFAVDRLLKMIRDQLDTSPDP
jgi:CheY-like chemotaxis protein